MTALVNLAKLINNEVTLYFIVMIIGIAIIIPLYNSNVDKRRKRDLDREKLIINVIQANTQVNAGLKVLLETNNLNCVQCKTEQSNKMDLVINSVSTHNDKLVKVLTILEEKKEG